MGRFLNADAFTATGQGLLGNNMFAYCNNNPVNFLDLDKKGRAADSYAGRFGELFGEWLYELFTGKTHPNKQARELETRIIEKQNKVITNGVNKITDAYVQGNKLQQESQKLESQMMLEGATKIYKYLGENEDLSQGLSGGAKIGKGILNIVVGGGAILVPAPTPAEDVMGVKKITWGVINVCYGIAEVIGALTR